ACYVQAILLSCIIRTGVRTFKCPENSVITLGYACTLPHTGLTGKYATTGITAYQPIRITGYTCNVYLTQLQNTAS
ncbi:hypothetical protein N8Y69_25230, partial [Enterobacter hormaechei subsp. steigerwaltii]